LWLYAVYCVREYGEGAATAGRGGPCRTGVVRQGPSSWASHDPRLCGFGQYKIFISSEALIGVVDVPEGADENFGLRPGESGEAVDTRLKPLQTARGRGNGQRLYSGKVHDPGEL
jgi:hypothetical protein